jgi:hypothetical protein
MPNETDDQQDAPRGLSRRNLFKRAGIVGTLAATAGTTLALTAAVTARAQTPAPAAPPLEALETLTAAESDILEAIVARLIPADDNGPGAAEARAAHTSTARSPAPSALHAGRTPWVSPRSTPTRSPPKAPPSPHWRRQTRTPC